MPTYQTPDESVRAFMQLVDYRRNQELLMQTPPAILPGVADGAAARAVLSRARGEGRQVLTEPEAKALLAELEANFLPRPLQIVGLASWWYRGGPWQPLSEHRFR